MPPSVPGQELDFAAYIADRTHGFIDRDWILREIDNRLNGPTAPRMLLLTGAPGTGKTAVSARLAQISRGAVEPPVGTQQLRRGTLDALHFCSARNAAWIEPTSFCRSLALQLTALPGFATALFDATRDSTNIRVEIHAEAAGKVQGVVIHQLHVHDLTPIEAFTQLVATPLTQCAEQAATNSVRILVDGLDEALLAGGESIVDLLARRESFPARVQLILTARPDEPRILARFPSADRLNLSDEVFGDLARDDVRSYVRSRCASDPGLIATPPAVIEQVVVRSEGNFQYARFLFDSAARDPAILASPRLPQGLDALYEEYLVRLVGLGGKDWAASYAVICGVMSVARRPLLASELHRPTDQAFPTFWAQLQDLSQLIEPERLTELQPPAVRYRLYHQSVIDFFRKPEVATASGEHGNRFFLPAGHWHLRLGDCYLESFGSDWELCEDTYALRHVAHHLAEAVRRAEPQPAHVLLKRLFGLLTASDYRTAYLTKFDDPPGFEVLLRSSIELTAQDRHTKAVPLLLGFVEALLEFRKAGTQPSHLFRLASAGELDAALRRLEAFGVERRWRLALMMILAGLAAPARTEQARTLLQRVRAERAPDAGDEVLDRLDGWTGAVCGLGLRPTLPLPAPPDLVEVVARIDRLSGNSTTMVEPLQFVQGIEEMAYLARDDTEQLVAFAKLEPEQGLDYLRQYLSIHAANQYAYYRNESLWLVLRGILAHPSTDWIKSILPEVAAGTLSESLVTFEEALPAAALAQLAHDDPVTWRAELERWLNAARDRANQIVPGRSSDAWSHHLRRLGIVAELRGAMPHALHEARATLDQADGLPFGFAGFRAPACLALADAAHTVESNDTGRVARWLERALVAAHNVQDPTFCARMTARVQAVARLARRPLTDAEKADEIERLTVEAQHGLTAGIHVAGEIYQHRNQDGQRWPVPAHLAGTTDIGAIAELFQVPLEAIAAANPEINWQRARSEGLARGQEVRVPDLELAAYLAAHLAARVGASPAIPPRRRSQLIARVVPASLIDRTALDLVLARLVMANPTVEADKLSAFAQRLAPPIAPTAVPSYAVSLS